MSDGHEPDWVRIGAELTGASSEEIKTPHSKPSTSESPNSLDLSNLSDEIEKHMMEDHRDEYGSMANDYWALMRVSEQLTEVLEDRGEFWLLQYRADEGFVPQLRAHQDEIAIDEDVHYEDTWMQYEDSSGVFNLEIVEIAEKSSKSGALIGRDPEVKHIGKVPRIDAYTLEETSEIALHGRYVAPGFEEAYRRAAENKIKRESNT